ncbi:ankyrin repeat domain-containing protein [Wolbachia endosymbiont of Folsomia candida]|uniref:ankyrin repeat domain-containing protein n=1 Tax=Wolbachia endosymbiont of Folsomia candida TaxID=169402 RepID=UPI000B0A92A9|nr:ankyrin repeat domain-containing protein [Wolbachia endosymbiont of Folsomia candida]APR99128.1 hypothetical protein ASM33_08095 [Wolbachia endosymbiont of Folsomia candida]
MKEYSIVKMLYKVNNLPNLDGKNVVKKIKNEFMLAIKHEDYKTERQTIETACKDWKDGGSKIDHFFKFNTYPCEVSNSRIYEQTLLHFAAKHGYQNVVNALLKAGAKIDVMDVLGRTPLYFAAHNGYMDVVNALISKGAKVDLLDFNSNTPLHLAAQNGHVNIVNALIKANADVNAVGGYENTALHLAAKNGHINVVNALIKAKAGVNAQNTNGYVSLHLAAQNGHIDVVNALIDAEAKTDLLGGTFDKKTPLHLAAENGYESVIQALVTKGANINAQSSYYKNTPLHHAFFEGHDGVVQYLIGKEANVLLKNDKGWTPSDCVNRGIPKLLKEAEKAAQMPVKVGVVVGIILMSLIATLLIFSYLPEVAIAGIVVGSFILIGTVVGGVAYMFSKPSTEIKVENTPSVEKIASEVPMPG